MVNIINPSDEDKKIKKPSRLTIDLLIIMSWCLVLALFWVVFLWGFWDKGVYAQGMNAFVFWSLSLSLFVWILASKKIYKRRDLVWLIPLGLIPLSYLLYDNPFIKGVNVLVYPLLFVFFINYGFLKDKETRAWNLNFVFRFIARFFSVFSKINEAGEYYFDLLLPSESRKKQVIKKAVLGIALFLIIAFALIIPLLSSADAEFSAKIQFIFDWLENLISQTLIFKIGFFFLLAMAFFSAVLAWGRSFDFAEKDPDSRRIDSISSGIVIGGILMLYLLFLWVQIERLWVGSLPFEFKDVENLVKSGFWQLLFLSIINIGIFFIVYRRTISAIQTLLTVFTAASLLLLLSAGQRMFLYVINYGFSYEKFFASYAVVFCLILFIWLIYRLFVNKKADIFKFVVFLFLWMFSLVTVFPVEQFIFRANLKLSELDNSRIRLYEMTMLSPDVLCLAKNARTDGRLLEKSEYFPREAEKIAGLDQPDWNPWIKRQEDLVNNKKWYEKNLNNFFSKCE